MVAVHHARWKYLLYRPELVKDCLVYFRGLLSFDGVSLTISRQPPILPFMWQTLISETRLQPGDACQDTARRALTSLNSDIDVNVRFLLNPR